MGREIVGSTAAELRAVGAAMRKMLKEGGPPPQGRWADLAVLEPVKDYKARHASTLLVFDAVEDAIAQIEAERGKRCQWRICGTRARPDGQEQLMDKVLEKKNPWLDPASVAPRRGSGYPAPFGDPLAGREKRALGDALHLTQFGVNLVTLAPGSWSSQRHWHANEDEFVYVLEGEVTLVTDAGEQMPRTGHGGGLSGR